ncbi:MAG TPA: response regulator [Thermoanaerobacterales bacterium]|nr:response regulator [Thermoanaerobacterales bacterium]
MADKLNNYIENLRRREDDLMIALHQAEQAKSQFLANMSHEIRTPMNAIIGMSYLTLRTELTARQKDYINKIHQSSTSLLKILNDIMDFSKIESGKMHIENIKFELKNIVENSIQYISIQAQEKGLEFVCRIPPKAPSHIKGDPLRLSEIISNLADNAVKFTEKGQVVIDVSPVGRVDNRVKLQFSISDTGIGMNKEQQKNLFVSFMQADSSTTRKYGGTGLGLPICKNLAELMGGKLEFTSEPDKGSNFIFTAWFEIAKGKSEIPKIMPHMIEGKKIMIVDDNCAARFTFREYLISMKFQTLAISSGEEAILETKKADTEDPFDVVFVDWEMNSGIDGIETAIEIKNSVEHVPKIVLLTISPEEDIYHEYSYCIDDVLVKPVSQSMIYDCLVNLFSPEYKETTNKHIFSEEDYGLSGFKVLLVEDNDINLQIATELLESQDIDVSVAKNGKEAIKLFSDMPSNSYDLILMDLQMPVMDGFEATRQIRGKDKNIPILAMSARTMVEEKQNI